MAQRRMTASAIITFIQRVETESSTFYDKLADIVKEDKEAFVAFAKEGRKNRNLIVRTYQETISDALEACFSFEGLDPKDYSIETAITQDTDRVQAVKMALNLEENASKLYADLAECSTSLLATIPRAFKRVAEMRKNRIPKLQGILDRLQ